MGKTIALAVIGLAIIALAIASYKSVDNGKVGVIVFQGEVSDTVLQPGPHFLNPFSSVHEISTQVQKAEEKGDAATLDMQSVNTEIAVNYHLNGSSIVPFYRHIGPDYEGKILAPAVREVFKAVTAKYTSEQLITKREDVRQAIESLLQSRMQKVTDGAFVVDAVSITNFHFSRAFDQAIEAKQVAEQQVQKAKNDLQRIQVEAQQKVAEAQAEAAALAAQKQQVTPELVQLREIQAEQKAIEKWDGHLPQYTGGAMPFINLSLLHK